MPPAAGTSRPWTADEDDVLAHGWCAGTPVSEIVQALPGRSAKAARVRASKIGLKRPPGFVEQHLDRARRRKGRPTQKPMVAAQVWGVPKRAVWTAAGERRLAAGWLGGEPAQTIAADLSLTVRQVVEKARRMNLARPPGFRSDAVRFTKQSRTTAAEYSPEAIKKWIARCGLTTKRLAALLGYTATMLRYNLRAGQSPPRWLIAYLRAYERIPERERGMLVPVEKDQSP